MLTRVITSLGLTALVFSSITSFQVSAAPKELKVNRRQSQDLTKVIKNLKDKDPQKVESKKLSKNNSNQDELNSDQGDLTVKFSLKDKKVKLNNKVKGDLTLSIPNSDQFDSVDVVDDKVIYSGASSKTDIIIESVDGGLRQVINIKSSDAPSFYDFPIELANGDYIELATEGGASVKSANGKVKTIIGKPWAIDANSKELKTWYTINGNSIRQNIDLGGAVFPVMADPIWCGQVASSVGWVYRNIYNNVFNWSLQIKPTECGKNNARFNHEASWDEVYAKTSMWYNVTRIWNKSDNFWSMKNQYFCHVDFVQFANLLTKPIINEYRDTYNLEPWRSDKGYWGFSNIWDRCN